MSRLTLLAFFLTLTSLVSSNPLPQPQTTPAPLTPSAITKSSQVIHPAFSTSKCLTASSNANNAPVQIEDCVLNKPSQLWSTTSTGQYVIYGNKCLDNTGGKVVNGNKLQIYTCNTGNTNQEWVSIGNFGIQLKGTNECMDLTNGNRDNGNVVQIWQCTSGGNQQWHLADGNTVPPPPTTTSTPTGPTPTNHIIRSIKSDDSCLTAASNTDQAKVVIEPCDGSVVTQTWTITGDGTIRVFGNKCLDVPSGSTTNGVKMQIYTCFTGNTNQQFTLMPAPTVNDQLPLAKGIVWKGRGECLDLTDSNLSDGAQMQMWACGNDNHNQIWNIL